MAYILQKNEGLTQEQAAVLRELNSFQQVSESIAWKKLVERLDTATQEAQEALMGCQGGLEQRGVLALRWQQREAIRRDIVGFMDAQLDQRKQLLEELKEQENEHNPGDSGTDNQ